MIYVSHMQNFSTWVEGYSSGIRYDCSYDIFDTAGKQQYGLTDCFSGDYAYMNNIYNDHLVSFSWPGDSDDNSINLCVEENCYLSKDLSLSNVINRETLETSGHLFFSYWLPGSSKTKVLLLDSYDSGRNQVDIFVIDLDQKESRLIVEGADLSYYTINPNFSLSPDGKWILYVKNDPERKNYIAATDGSSIQPFMELPRNTKLPIWSADSSSMYLFITQEEGNETGYYNQQVIRIDPVTLETEVVVEGDSIFGSYFITPGREECFFTQDADIIYCGSFMVNMSQSPAVVKPLIQEAWERQDLSYLSYSLSLDQSRVIYSVLDTNVDDPFDAYFMMDVETGEYQKFDDFAFVGSWSPDGRLVLAYDVDAYDEGDRNLFIIDTVSMKIVNTIPQGTDPIDAIKWIP